MTVHKHVDLVDRTRRRRQARHAFVSAVVAGCLSISACSTASEAAPQSSTGRSGPGSAPQPPTPYIINGVLHDGSRRVKLPTADVTSFKPLEGGGAVVGVLGGPVPNTNLIVDKSGTVLRTLTDVLWTVSADESHIVTGDGKRVVVLDPAGREVAGRVDPRYPIAMVGDLVYLTDGREAPGAPPSLEWDTRDGSTRELPPNLAVVSPDTRVAVTRAYDTPTRSWCHEVFALTDDSVHRLRKVCGARNGVTFYPRAASPDGTYLIGSNEAVRSLAPVVVVLRTTDGSVVVGRPSDPELRAWSVAMPTSGSVVLSRSTPDANRLESCTLASVCTPLTSGVANDPGGGVYILPAL